MIRRITRRIACLLVVFAMLVLNLGTAGLIPARADTGTISESFMNSTAPGWELKGNAVLTKTTVDSDGSGWLRLTEDVQSQAGAAVYDTALSTQHAFEIQFDYASYGGGPGADGIAFYMMDGSADPTLTGAGGGLGYIGIPGAYFAVGLDEYGVFSGFPGPAPHVAIRDASSVLTSAAATVATGSRAGFKHVRIAFYNRHISVWLAGVQIITDTVVPAAPPATIKFGLSAATGGYSNFHEVQNFTAAYTSIDSLRVTPGGGYWPCGASWANACSLQTALSAAQSGVEIWAAAGTYKPTTGTDRSATFQLKDGVALYGGFAGTESERSQRDPAAHISALSGDLNGDDAGFSKNAENVYHVVSGASGATLDGFIIAAGNANGTTPNDIGGGMFNSNSSPTLTNVTFGGNSASAGGGMYNHNSSPTLTNVTFSGNSAANYGGGMINDGSPTLTNVTFSGNSALVGGGMFNGTGSSPSLTNVTFSGNTAEQYGGGMNNFYSSPAIHNSIFWGNTAPNAAQIYNAIDNLGSTSAVSDSVVQGGCPAGSTCTNIITADPLLGTLGNYGGSTQTIPLLAGSSAIDAGDDFVCPAADQRGMPRPQGAHCDIGAFEYHGTFFVKPAATGKGDCGSWADACILQTALAWSNGVSGNEIWAAAGTYKPTTGTDRSATFQLKDGVALYGGFAGTESGRGQRNPAAHISLLSGDLNGDDVGFSNNAENSYHVVTGASGASLDGFTISGGNADGAQLSNYGGGMYNLASSPTVTNVTFSGNTAGEGGGMYNNNISSPTLTNVTFNGNKANSFGGGMANWFSSPVLTNVTFSGNTAIQGGGMFNMNSGSTLTNVTFSSNMAAYNGGGMYNGPSFLPQIRNTIFWGNTAPDGAQIRDDYGLVMRDSVVQGGYYGGTHILTDDPLLGTLGNYGGFTRTIPLLRGSSAIDTGDDSICPATDQRGVSRLQGAHCDIGAFEYNSHVVFLPMIRR